MVLCANDNWGDYMKYYEVIKNDYEDERLYPNQDGLTFTEYLASSVFGFNTYESDVESTLVEWAVMASKSILARTTFELIKSNACNFAYLTILQTCFFSDKIEWGTSIRGVWFHIDKPCKISNFTISKTEDLIEFMSDIVTLYEENKAP